MITPEDIQQIRTIIQEEIQKASKNPQIKWKFLDIAYGTTTSHVPDAGGALAIRETSPGTATLRFNVGDASNRGRSASITIDSIA